jgi:hypothetical protein
MWLTEDEDIKAIEEIEGGTDRVVAVVAGAIVDARLSNIIRLQLHRDDTEYSSAVRKEISL